MGAFDLDQPPENDDDSDIPPPGQAFDKLDYFCRKLKTPNDILNMLYDEAPPLMHYDSDTDSDDDDHGHHMLHPFVVLMHLQLLPSILALGHMSNADDSDDDSDDSSYGPGFLEHEMDGDFGPPL